MHHRFSIFLAISLIWGAALSRGQAPAWDNSGARLLSGSYNLRHVRWDTNAQGSITRSRTIYGSITFDGSGTYNVNGQIVDSTSSLGVPVTYQRSGTFRLAASGVGYLSNPFGGTGDIDFTFSGGILSGSGTETGANDLLIAAQAPSPAPTNARMDGRYWVAYIDFPGSNARLTRDALFALDANGQGALAPIQVTGYVGNSATQVSQTISGATYSFRAGSGLLNLSGQTLITGQKVIDITSDGNFIFGGSPNGFDLFVGIKASTAAGTNALRDGLYYHAGVYEELGGTTPEMETFYGSFKSSAGTVLLHRRLFTPVAGSYDFTYDRTDVVRPDATLETDSFRYVVGANGAVQIGSGKGPRLGLNLAVRTTPANGTGVFIDPSGVVNAASSAMFTVGVSRGQLITLYGSGLSPRTTVDGSFPLLLEGVRVLINNRPAPIYVVSPTQLSVIVPWGTTETVAAIQVINNGVSSNIVTQWVNASTPGIFTDPPGGLGIAAVLHTNYTRVTRANPARPGEVVQLYLAGLGEVRPPVEDRAPGPSNVLATVVGDVIPYVDGQEAQVSFKGLPPGLTALYQVNFTVPNGVRNGDVYLEISSPGAFNSQALLPIAGGSSALLQERSREGAARKRPLAD